MSTLDVVDVAENAGYPDDSERSYLSSNSLTDTLPVARHLWIWISYPRGSVALPIKVGQTIPCTNTTGAIEMRSMI